MGKTAGRARFARIGIAVAVLVVLAGVGVALAMTVGGLAPAGGSNALVVEEPTTRPQDTLEAEPETSADAAAQEAPVEEAAPPAPTPSTTGALKVVGAQLTDAVAALMKAAEEGPKTETVAKKSKKQLAKEAEAAKAAEAEAATEE